MKKLIFVIIILIIAGTLGFWWWQKKSDPTANWQTYRNEKYGFELKYPEGFSYSESYPEFVSFDKKEIISDQCGQGIGSPGCGINLDGILKRIDYVDVNETVEIIPLGSDSTLSETEEILLGSNYFTKVRRISSWGTEIFYLLDDNGLIYIFVVLNDYEAIADQILSTFRFLE